MSIATDEAARGGAGNGHAPDRMTSIPDPSTATQQMLLREVTGARELGKLENLALRDLIANNKIARDVEVRALKELLENRVGATEAGIKLAHENEARWPTTLDREITAVKEYFGVLLDTVGEKFISVNRRFEERDQRMHDNEGAARISLSAALTSAKDAVKQAQDASDKAIYKQEAAFGKLIEEQAKSAVTTKNEIDRRVDDLKTTVTTMMAIQAGRKEQTVERNDNTTLIYGAIGVLVGLGGLVAAFLARTAG